MGSCAYSVTAGHDFGNQIEIVAGLKPDDQVMSTTDSIITGQQVQIVSSIAGISSETRSKVIWVARQRKHLGGWSPRDRCVPVEWMHAWAEISAPGSRVPPAYKEVATGNLPSRMTESRRNWWEIFQDLNSMPRSAGHVSNQNLKPLKPNTPKLARCCATIGPIFFQL